MTTTAEPLIEPEESVAPETPEAAPETSFEERYLSRVFRPNLLLIAAFVGLVIVLAPAAAKFVPSLENHPDYRMKASAISIPKQPAWVPTNLLGQILKRADIPNELSVLDRDLVLRVGQAFETHPWIKGPVTVRITIPAHIQVTFEYREPVAMVGVNEGLYPVDGQGLLLPPDDFPIAELKYYPRIVGVGTPPTGSIGEKWGDERVTAAARLAGVVAPYWAEFQLEAIEVPKRETAELNYDELEFVLICKSGSRILWGKAPGNGHPLEVTDDQKIGRLKEFMAKSKTIDGPWEVDINNFVEITYHGLEKPVVEKPRQPVKRRR